jgi:hypothetical protein
VPAAAAALEREVLVVVEREVAQVVVEAEVVVEREVEDILVLVEEAAEVPLALALDPWPCSMPRD